MNHWMSQHLYWFYYINTNGLKSVKFIIKLKKLIEYVYKSESNLIFFYL